MKSLEFNEKTTVPVGWVLVGFGAMISVTIAGAFWVAAVNFRLCRIEQHLGIHPISKVEPSPFTPAFAK